MATQVQAPDMPLTPERGYNAAKRRKPEFVKLEQDDYSVWLTANQLTDNTTKSMLAALVGELEHCPAEDIKDIMMNMASLIDSCPKHSTPLPTGHERTL